MVTQLRTNRGRVRTGFGGVAPRARPLLETTDEGKPVRVTAAMVGATGERWIDPFLAANKLALRRLGLSPEVRSAGGLHMRIYPSGKIGAVALVAPATRRVAVGVLVRPRFRWSALGDVMSTTGFSVAPTVGDGEMVPGSARDVPSWIIAGPVLRRIEEFLSHRRASFLECTETRSSARGGVRWGEWLRQQLPIGDWATLPCRFSDLADDPILMNAIRWTLHRLDSDLAVESGIGPATQLRVQVERLLLEVGQGPSTRPTGDSATTLDSWSAGAVEGMKWVAEGRGLGGSGALDGLPWDLVVAELWEEWVRVFAHDLAPRSGLVVSSSRQVRRPLRWKGPVSSMRSLAPDVGLFSSDRCIWLDAKYKAHLALIGRNGWSGVDESVREAHRADLHQVLAYASLADVSRVDTILVYPSLRTATRPDIQAVATVTSGHRKVRLILAELPFGFSTPFHRDAVVSRWREFLAD